MLQRVLANAKAYQAARRIIGAEREMQTMVDEYIKPTPEMSLLDIGCGNGRLVPFVPNVRYVGIDHNPSYIDDANERWGSTGATFLCGDLATFPEDELGLFDVVVSIGVLHHLDDETSINAISEGVKRLKPGGRFITMDPCFEPSQRQTARVLMALDRGKFVRHPNNYLELLKPYVTETTASVRHDIYAFPYTHFITTSTVG